jgi:uncharacterized protein (TIRG00374 family)
MSVRVPRWLRRGATIFGFVLVVEYLVVPQIAGTHQALHLLGNVEPWLVGAGVALEAAALLAYAQLTRAVLPRSPETPGLFTLLRVDLSTLAVAHVLPGGTAPGAALGYRLLTGLGVRGADAGFAAVAQSIGSAVVLNLLLWIGLVISIPLRGVNPLYSTVAAIGAVLIAGFALLVLALTRGERHAAGLLRAIASRLPLVSEDKIEALVQRFAERIRELAKDRALLARAVGWAAANWLLDMASLWVFVTAFGYRVSPDGLLISYGLANVLAAIPITPSGLGVVETVLTSSLVGFGSPRGIAILGVVGWRLVNFWLPIPVGAAAYVSLRTRGGFGEWPPRPWSGLRGVRLPRGSTRARSGDQPT